MDVLESKQLKNYTSMRIGGPATYIVTAHNEQDVADAAAFALEKNLPLITLGDGTNVVFSDEGFKGIVVVNEIAGFTISPTGIATIGAGENWDETVAKTISAGFCGIESLSLVPGTTGATPVNNVGAYGQEISHTLVSVRAFDTQTNEFVELPNAECGFSYRTSRFKNEDHGRFIITNVKLQLKPIGETYEPPTYPSLTAELTKLNLEHPNPQQVREAVIAIRTSKLPDPKTTPNVGSFFKNPIVTKNAADQLKADYPNAPIYPHGENFKVAAGWLIEQAGLKGYHQNGITVYDKQALVLVNESASTFSELKKTYEHIQQVVYQKFNIQLEPEPELL